jgi:diketogulonate reductase-like aldo/keto reductase
MELKRLGSTTTSIPAIGLGTSGYSGDVEALRVGIECGACLIDTAENYGNEEFIGKAIRGLRDRVFLSTKVAPLNLRRRDLIAAAEGSLRRLGTDRIDLYQLHWPNCRVPIEESMGAMEELVDAGKVRFVGVSNFSAGELRAAQAATSRLKIVSNQVRYSLIDRSVEGGLLQYCQRNGITIIAYSPLGRDFQRFAAHDPEGVMTRLAGTSHKTCAQIALNWLIAKENVVAIPRASGTAHMVENCEASGWRLAEDEYRLLDAKIRCRRIGKTGAMLRRWKRNLAQFVGRTL